MPSRPWLSNGIRFAPDRPNNSIASAALLTPFGIDAKRSAITSSASAGSLNCLGSMFNRWNASAAGPAPSLASSSVRASFRRLFSSSSTGTPACPAANDNALKFSVLVPIFCALLLASSIALIALLTWPTNATTDRPVKIAAICPPSALAPAASEAMPPLADANAALVWSTAEMMMRVIGLAITAPEQQR